MSGQRFQNEHFLDGPNELSYAERQQRTQELRNLQRGIPLRQVSPGGGQERGEVMPKAQKIHTSGGDTQRRRK